MRCSRFCFVLAVSGLFAAGCASAAQPAVASTARAEGSSGGEVAHAHAAPLSSKVVEIGRPLRLKKRRSFFDMPLNDCRGELDYNSCIVQRLEGDTRSQEELIALIQSQRMLGHQDAARRDMRRFVQRYPGSPLAKDYAQYVELESATE